MTNETRTFKPKVNPEREFVEIATDFSNPLELVREMISNSFDAGAKTLDISFSVEKNDEGEDTLKIVFEDDGSGISQDEMEHNFFDLGNSSRRGDAKAIGEKGHGTKVAFNSSCIEVESVSRHNPKVQITAKVLRPLARLNNGEMPEVECKISPYSGDKASYTKITVWGYNRNRRGLFHHQILRDYILWFTKFGSFEGRFEEKRHEDVVITLQGLGENAAEKLAFGHHFPEESEGIDKLIARRPGDAPDHYCKHFSREGELPNFPEIKYQAFFSVEGNKVKRGYNKLLRGPGRTVVPDNAGYTVQDRYGLWLCKDFIPIQRANSWVAPKGSEYTRLHAFFNCQGFNLTANRGSVNNTESEKMAEVEKVVKSIFDDISKTEGWQDFDWLEAQVVGYKASERENSEYQRRIRDFNRTQVASYKERLLVEPLSENGVYGLVVMLLSLNPAAFPFAILDYNTRVGIDLIVKGTGNGNISNSTPFYVELKYFLGENMNHSFKNLHTIVCWDTMIRDGGEVVDVQDKSRTMQIISADANDNPDGYTKYLLDAPASNKKIECIVLKQYLKEKLGIDFRPRTKEEQVLVPAKK